MREVLPRPRLTPANEVREYTCLGGSRSWPGLGRVVLLSRSPGTLGPALAGILRDAPSKAVPRQDILVGRPSRRQRQLFLSKATRDVPRFRVVNHVVKHRLRTQLWVHGYVRYLLPRVQHSNGCPLTRPS